MNNLPCAAAPSNYDSPDLGDDELDGYDDDAWVETLDPEIDPWDSDLWDDFVWELGPDAGDRDWWASQNIEWHATDLITPETDGIDPWTHQLEQLAADYDAGRYPTWVD